MPRHFVWQAWHLVTSTFVSRGRCGTWRHLPSFCDASVALRALGSIWWPKPALAAGDAAALCVAGVALGDIHLRFAWQVWHLETFTCVWRGTRGNFVIYHLSHTNSFTIFHTPAFTHRLSHPTLSHTIFHTIFHTPRCHPPSLTHHLSHTTLSHTIFDTPLCHTPSFTQHLCHTLFHTPLCHPPSLTHHLSHTTLPHSLFDTPLCHTPLCLTLSFTTPSFTPHSVTHHLSPHHLSQATLSHTIFHHTSFHTQLCHTPSFATPSFTHNLSHTTLSHMPSFFVTPSFHIQPGHTQLCFTSRFSATSFVFPSFPVPATTFGAHYWKKLPCGVIRSFTFVQGVLGTVLENSLDA